MLHDDKLLICEDDSDQLILSYMHFIRIKLTRIEIVSGSSLVNQFVLAFIHGQGILRRPRLYFRIDRSFSRMIVMELLFL